MDIVKKNMLSIACGVVALLAVIAYFWPIGPMLADQQQRLEGQAAKYKELEDLKNKQRKQPVVSPDTAEAPPLEPFPNNELVSAGVKVVEQLRASSASVLQAAVQLNKRPELVPGTLPVPGRTGPFQFREAYLDQMGRVSDPVGTSAIAQKVLQAGQPPTQQAIERGAFELWQKEYDPKVWELSNQPQNLNEISAEFVERARRLPLEMRQDAAQKYMIYMDPDALSLSPAVGPQSTPSALDIWFAQVGLWVQYDVASAIADINRNAPATSVLDAPVKHLRKIIVAHGPAMYGLSDQALAALRAGAGAAAAPPPVAVGPYANRYGAPPPAAAPAPDASGKDYSRSPTGRVTNNLYDVVPFTLVIRVDARKIPSILRELEVGRFLTVHRVNAVTVDTSAAFKQEGFLYGMEDAQGRATAAAPTTQPAGSGNGTPAPAQPAAAAGAAAGGGDGGSGGSGQSQGAPVPIAELTIDGEALFLRQWTVPLMPPDIKTMLNVQEAAPAEGGTTPVASGS